MTPLRTVALTTAAWVIAVVVLGGAFIWSGLYPVAATRDHLQVVYSVLETALERSVRFAARDVVAPSLTDPALVSRGAGCFRDHCVQCHGAPGVAPGPVGRGMQPLPGPLVDAQQRWNTRELYWITKHGIRMSGMPAWQYRLPEDDLWALVAFVEHLPQMGPTDYAAAVGQGAPVEVVPGAAAPATACGFTQAQRDAPLARVPDPARGRTALSQYACTTCHSIPGVTGSQSRVGPPLEGWAQRTVIAGKLTNTADNMVRWLRHPQQVDPQTSMPDLAVSEADARDIAAYLATLR